METRCCESHFASDCQAATGRQIAPSAPVTALPPGWPQQQPPLAGRIPTPGLRPGRWVLPASGAGQPEEPALRWEKPGLALGCTGTLTHSLPHKNMICGLSETKKKSKQALIQQQPGSHTQADFKFTAMPFYFSLSLFLLQTRLLFFSPQLPPSGSFILVT